MSGIVRLLFGFICGVAGYAVLFTAFFDMSLDTKLSIMGLCLLPAVLFGSISVFARKDARRQTLGVILICASLFTLLAVGAMNLVLADAKSDESRQFIADFVFGTPLLLVALGGGAALFLVPDRKKRTESMGSQHEKQAG